MPEGDASTRAEVLAARSKYSLPYGEATAAAHRAMNVILQHFGTEVAAATAIHDGAFGNLLGTQLEFPPVAASDLPLKAGAVEVPGTTEGAGSKRAKVQDREGEGGNATDVGVSQGNAVSSGRSPRDRMIDVLDRSRDGWGLGRMLAPRRQEKGIRTRD
jgi:hypothetical protein